MGIFQNAKRKNNQINKSKKNNNDNAQALSMSTLMKFCNFQNQEKNLEFIFREKSRIHSNLTALEF